MLNVFVPLLNIHDWTVFFPQTLFGFFHVCSFYWTIYLTWNSFDFYLQLQKFYMFFKTWLRECALHEKTSCCSQCCGNDFCFLWTFLSSCFNFSFVNFFCIFVVLSFNHSNRCVVVYECDLLFCIFLISNLVLIWKSICQNIYPI